MASIMCYILDPSLTVALNQNAMTIPVLYEEWQIDFKLTINNKGSGVTRLGIIHLTNTNNKKQENGGDAVPLLQSNTKLKKIFFVTTFNNDTSKPKIYKKSPNIAELARNVKKDWQIKQEVADGGYKLSVTYDGGELFSNVLESDVPSEFTDVRVLVCGDFKAVIDATMEDLVIQTCKCRISTL